MPKNEKFILRFFVGLSLVFGLFFINTRQVRAAASLYVSPAGGSFTIGSTFTVSILLDTGGQAVNAVEADLSFPANKLQVVSPSAGKSLIQTWVTQPNYSNKDGTLRFQGVVPNPGIAADSGLISTVTFRVKDIGTAQIRFLDASRVLLNDGKGTDILDKTSGGTYFLTLPPPAGPIVTSRTNPDQEKWYHSATAVFEWTAPPDIQGYSYVLNEDPAGIPDDISEGVSTRVSYSNLSDGIHYFHIKALRQNVWGGVTDYEVKIDRSPPAEFPINVIPGTYTSQKIPFISFYTTDNESGINHYELAIISLNKTDASENNSPFFIETISPYVKSFDLGHYQIVVRAYDSAGNYYQAQTSLTIVNPIFEILGSQGVRIGGLYVLSWPYAGLSGIILLAILFYVSRRIWRLHAQVEEYLRHGVLKHPLVEAQIQELKSKQEEYRSSSSGNVKTLIIAGLILFSGIALLLGGKSAHAANGLENISGPKPPIITLFPQLISNDEILYIGGEANVPNATVLIYLEETGTNATIEKTVPTDKDGKWFYSFPEFLDSGRYIAWAQLKVGEALSPPSSQAAITVAPTAFQIGKNRLSAQDLYLILTIIFLVAFLGLLAFIVYHAYHARRKNRRLREEIKRAEESVRRGFSVLRRDIEEELATVHRAKLAKGLSEEEKMREEKLLKDLEMVTSYIGKEIWEIEKAEGAL